jgi:hypothetical protein
VSVSSAQRFTASKPCPVCGGYEGAERGNGSRCYGFFSTDGKYAHCARIDIFEGEPDADAARELGLVATTNIRGAGKFTDDIVPYFRGADVRINADNDEDGRKHLVDDQATFSAMDRCS